jgi:hypothetical protein
MANNTTLKKVFAQVQSRLESGQYHWISQDNQPEDYFDWGLRANITADDIIQTMIEDGDLEAAE